MTSIRSIDHVQLAMPPGEEGKACTYYGDILGMRELPKPAELAKRGGAWFGTGSVQLHLGVEADFRPAKKAHVALTVSGAAGLKETLSKAGYPVREDQDIEGVKRFFSEDAFGNRIEFIEID